MLWSPPSGHFNPHLGVLPPEIGPWTGLNGS